MKKTIKKLLPKTMVAKIENKKKNKIVDIYKKNYAKITPENVKKISVIVPNYNYEKFLQERLDSIILQTYPIFELIILDDASTDNSDAFIKKYIEDHEEVNIHYLPNKKNSNSVFSQWQKGFKKASGDYVWIAEADDSCNLTFLEHLMQGFDDEETVISYAESMRIDENNRIISTNCRDWMGAASLTHWDHSYIHSGEQEIREVLSVLNSIPNVSGVVFKKVNQIELLEEAKQFQVSGDWYLYYKLLEQGGIAYTHKSLNYFRKHSSSKSTVTKKEIELKELLTIQKDIRLNHNLSSEQIKHQSYRYGEIINNVNKSVLKQVKPLIAKKIAWIIPAPIKGSGGIRTMIMNAEFLRKRGYEVDIYVEEDYVSTNENMKERIAKYYGGCKCNVFVGIELQQDYDLAFCTYSIRTGDYLYSMDRVKHKAYFIQDFEPWFEPMGGLFLEMERSYRYGFYGVSIGKWLTYKLSNEFNHHMNYFDFCADLNVYKKLPNVRKENAVCFVFQPEKPRRAAYMGLQALKILQTIRPDVKIYLYGADAECFIPMEVENLKIITIEECNELYNKCTAGLCISSSNPSRIPFEMMAAGLPVVDLYRENNLYDIPDGVVLLADSSPEAIATALIKILDHPKLQKQMSKAGYEYMQNFAMEKGFEQFLQFVEDVIDDKIKPNNQVKQIYNVEKIMPSKEVLRANKVIKIVPVAKKHTSSRIRFLVRAKHLILRKYNFIIRKIFRV